MHPSFVYANPACVPLRAFWTWLHASVAGWVYTAEDGRDYRIDLLRGLAVLAMVIDHLAGPSKLYLITGGNRFYTSAAEGFIFLSGLTVGLVYRRIAERQGFPTAIRRLLEQDPLRARLSENAARDARARFDLDRLVEAYLEWYGEISVGV